MPLGELSQGVKIGPYRVIHQIGAGGMGRVFLAADDRLGRQVAIKVLSAGVASDAVARERLLREARAASRINHPNVVAIYDVGEADVGIYLVLEYVDGDAMSTVMARGPMPMGDIVRIGIQVASALDAAHARGVIHRDIKPANILLTSGGDAKVADFGLALRLSMPVTESSGNPTSAAESRLTREGYAAGTVAYMSPEQVRGNVPDGRSDIFSLGAVLYEAVTHRLPFQGSTALATGAAILDTAPEPVRTRRPDAPAGLAAVITRCLQKESQNRPQSGAAVVEALRLVQSGESTRTVRKAMGPRAFPWLFAAGVLAAVVLVAVAAMLWGTRPIHRGGSSAAAAVANPEVGRLLTQSQNYALRGTNKVNLAHATDLARRALALAPKDGMLQAHLADMVARLQAEDRDPSHTAEIEQLASSALRSNPNLAEAWFARAWSHLWTRDFAGALDAATKGRDLAPDAWEGRALVGRALVRAGRVDEGLAELRRSMEVEGGHIFGRSMLGFELYELMRLDEAAVEFTKVLEYQPDHPAALNNLANIYLFTGRYLDSVPLYQKLMDTQPDAVPASNLGTALFYLDRVPEAIAAYQRANKLDPHNSGLERNLGDAYDRSGDAAEARRWYLASLQSCEEAMNNGAPDPDVQSSHAVLLARLGRIDEAVREIDALVAKTAKNFRVVYAGAQVHAMAGHRSETFALVSRAIALGYPREEFRRDPYFGSLLKDTEFLDLLVR